LPELRVDDETIRTYHEHRDFPGHGRTTHASLHLRFGTVSPRALVRRARQNEKYLNELIWREFFMQVLWHHPYVADGPFRKAYESVPWRQDESGFEKWQLGETGFPIVDAGMRELAETGFMHNRVRMITANFLSKILLVNWQWGEAWFAEKLTDFELSSNNGNWQWSAGCGCDAAPYFRIFNPYLQARKFDPDGAYIRKWLPGYDPEKHPEPIVDFNKARQRALDAYKSVLAAA
jgi:deoxyribodipyrimidine photo-lyase